ncbi:wax ester/triacylglycerol synthase domain-containing protein [Actinospongicola halichondriae]|uniref:wax ester/triacylglycerol synthase domain-containing protein n=1 Tax=Actinospongicola halichondriae TaxID=3236844 RepID=UPI003D385DB8
MVTRERVRDTDALMWNIEIDPILRSTIVVVGMLDRSPDRERLRDTFASASSILPRFEQRVVGTGGRAEHWETVEADPDFHVRFVRAPGAGSVRDVLDLAAPLTTAAFDPARPLWEVLVVDGVETDRAAVIMRMHHAVTDGVGGVALAGLLFDGERSPSATRVEHVAAAPPAAGLRLVHAAMRAAGQAGHQSVRFATHPLDATKDVLQTAESIGHLLAPATTPCSPLMTERGLSRRLDTLDIDLERFHAAARSAGVTLNEAFLAAVGRGVAEYHEQNDSGLDRLRVTMPISIRDPDDPLGGNRFVPARFELGVTGTVAESVARSRTAVRAARDEPSLAFTDPLAAVLRQLPAPAAAEVLGAMLTGVDVDVVDVAGFDRPAFVAGSRIDRLYAFAPPTGAAMSVTFLSHLDHACIGIETDRRAIEDPEQMARCLEAGFDAIVAEPFDPT